MGDRQYKPIFRATETVKASRETSGTSTLKTKDSLDPRKAQHQPYGVPGYVEAKASSVCRMTVVVQNIASAKAAKRTILQQRETLLLATEQHDSEPKE